MDHLRELAHNNILRLDELGISAVDTQYDPDAARTAAHTFMKATFGEQVYDAFNDSDQTFQFPVADSLLHKEVMGKINRYDAGMILVRPEMFAYRHQFADYLRRQGFRIHFEKETVMDPATYAGLYIHAITEAAAQETMPSRSIVYLDSPLQLYVFDKGEAQIPEGMKLADHVFRNLKGREGVPDKPGNETLRSGVVFKAALAMGLHRLTDKVLQYACDPLGTYRRRVSDPNNHLAHIASDLQLLKYVAVGVHIPNYSELQTDLPALVSDTELVYIANSLAKANHGRDS